MKQATLKDPGASVRSPDRLSHVVIRTNNFEKVKAFYKTFLGAYPVMESEQFSFLTYDSESHRIGIFNMPHLAPLDKKANGLEHISFAYESLDDLAIAALQRRENGIEPVWATNHGPTMSIYYRDPDGTLLETQVDVFSTIEENLKFMSSDQYKTNPIGVDFTLDELVARLNAGESHDSIMKRPESGPRGVADVPPM